MSQAATILQNPLPCEAHVFTLVHAQHPLTQQPPPNPLRGLCSYHYLPMQYNTTQCNTIQCNAMQCNTAHEGTRGDRHEGRRVPPPQGGGVVHRGAAAGRRVAGGLAGEHDGQRRGGGPPLLRDGACAWGRSAGFGVLLAVRGRESIGFGFASSAPRWVSSPNLLPPPAPTCLPSPDTCTTRRLATSTFPGRSRPSRSPSRSSGARSLRSRPRSSARLCR